MLDPEPRAARGRWAILAIAALVVVGCADEPDPEVVETARATCDMLPDDLADDDLGELGPSLLIFEAYDQVEHLASPEQFQDALEQECPDTMRDFDDLVEGTVDEMPDDAG